MTALAEPEIDTLEVTPKARLLLVGILWIVAATGLIVCHGCHSGDHDDELSLPLVQEEINHG